jgi:hypothetical protein
MLVDLEEIYFFLGLGADGRIILKWKLCAKGIDIRTSVKSIESGSK